MLTQVTRACHVGGVAVMKKFQQSVQKSHMMKRFSYRRSCCYQQMVESEDRKYKLMLQVEVLVLQ
jgi:hypothetical protein